MEPPQPARAGVINIVLEACARPIAVDDRISLTHYFRIARGLLRQANIYRNESNFLDLYIILLRYTSLLCETIPKHRDYHAFKLGEKASFENLVDVIKELETLKPVVQRQVAEHNRGGAVESNTNRLNGNYGTTRRIEQHTPNSYTTQPFVGSTNGALQEPFHAGRQVASLPSVQNQRMMIGLHRRLKEARRGKGQLEKNKITEENGESSSSLTESHASARQDGLRSLRATAMAGAKHPCIICMEPKAPSEVHRGSGACAHVFCRACLSGHVRAKLETTTGAVVRCPDPSCTEALNPELCRVVLPSDVFERWCAKLCESMFVGARRTYCPFPDCSEMMVADDGDAYVTQSECQVCRRLFCARCGVAPWHAGVTCDEFQRLDRGDRSRQDMMLYEMAEGMKWKRCPSCQFFVEKVNGCQHIRCRCGFEFCYGCGTSWRSGLCDCQR